ncbi:MAG: hypothetical protein ACYDDI_08955 [Candidatus Acidiferrales bacterium]
MSRISFSEIHEQPWFPNFLRNDVTDGLQFTLNFGRVYRPAASCLRKALKAAGTDRLVDLCSGAGGPWLWLCRHLEDEDTGKLEVCLTDKYPNIAAFERLHKASQGTIGYCAEPVDAARIPPQLRGFRTLFTSFHHFSPAEAAAIIQDAVDTRQGIGIFEAPRRRTLSILLTVLMPVSALLMAPFIRPFRLSRVVWTYLLPVIPFVLWFDGVLSCLRAYSPAELSKLIANLKANDYTWEIGEQTGWLAPITYMLGYPENPANNPATDFAKTAAAVQSGA